MPLVHLQAIPPILRRENTVVSSETGSGKTLAYLLPLVELLSSVDLPACIDPVVLVVVPNQELVLQLQGVIETLFPHTVAKHTRYAYANIGPGRRKPCAVLVTTPPALETNIPHARLRHLSSIVLDEADMLLSGDYMATVENLLLAGVKRGDVGAPSGVQHVFVAATIPATGNKGIQAYLDKFYASATTAATDTRHKPPPNVHHCFVKVGDWGAWHAMRQVDAAIAAAGSAIALTGRGDSDPTPRLNEAGELVQPAVLEAASHLLAVDDVVNARRPRSPTEQPERPADGIAPSAALVSMYHATVDAKRRYEEHLFSERCTALLELIMGTRTGDVDASGGMPALQETTSSLLQEGSDTPSMGAAVPSDADSDDGDSDDESEAGLHALASHATLHLAPWRFYSPLLDGEGGGEAQDEGGRPLAEKRPNPPIKAKDIPHDMAPALVFCSSGKTAKRVAKVLQGVAPTLKVATLHSKMAPVKRTERMQQLQRNEIQVLVATDLAARGLDTLSVKHVVQFDAASDAVSYLHRVGRTGRMGAPGRVSHLLTPVNAHLSHAIATAQAAGQSLEGVFSRKRSLRRKRKKAAAAAAAAGTGGDSDAEV